MCGRFDTSSLTWRDIHDALARFEFPLVTAAPNMEPNDDVRPTTRQLTLRLEEDGWRAEPMRWGLVPFWYSGKRLRPSARGAKDGFALTTFNARTEEVHAKPVFRGAFAKRRCLVPAGAWYEWKGETTPKTRYRFSRTDGAPIWFAGLYDRCTTADEGEIASFTILTAPSAGLLADYHSRAPVVLEPEEWSTWLDPKADPAGLFGDCRAERFAVAG